MNFSDYSNYDAVSLANGIAKGDFTCREVTEAAIAAIEKLNPKLNAVTIKNFDNARSASDRVQITTPLSGAPFLLKDVNVFTNDMPTTFSCRFFKEATPKPDSEIVSRWRNAGLIMLGKSNTPEFAEDYVCESTWRGAALNPWDETMTTGGSSGGAGAAVASGMVPMAHGTDLGGSIRIPAACCGVFGLKPTVGVNPVGPHCAEIASGFNSDHVLSRTVRDSAAALDVACGPVEGNRYRVSPAVGSYRECLEVVPMNLRVGVCSVTPNGEPVPARQHDAVALVANLLESEGHSLIEYRYPESAAPGDWVESLWMLDVYQEIENGVKEFGREPDDDELEALTRYLRERVASMSAMEHYRSRSRAHDASVKLMRSMASLDVLLTPALASDAIPLGALDSRTSAFDFESWAAQGSKFAPFSSVCNVTGQPAASLPVWLPDNDAPCAVQLAGHHCQDHLLLQLSRYLEDEVQWGKYFPPIWVGTAQ